MQFLFCSGNSNFSIFKNSLYQNSCPEQVRLWCLRRWGCQSRSHLLLPGSKQNSFHHDEISASPISYSPRRAHHHHQEWPPSHQCLEWTLPGVGCRPGRGVRNFDVHDHLSPDSQLPQPMFWGSSSYLGGILFLFFSLFLHLQGHVSPDFPQTTFCGSFGYFWGILDYFSRSMIICPDSQLPDQGCISCGILVSGIWARGVSSEHMENMEMFSCSPTYVRSDSHRT